MNTLVQAVFALLLASIVLTHVSASAQTVRSASPDDASQRLPIAWHEVTDGLEGGTVLAFANVPGESGDVYAGTIAGLYRYDASDERWYFVARTSQVYGIAIAPTGTLIAA
ncbi:MAG: hypothetical protein H7X80_12225, partial [bacterium]|nr:hypothetical protein [Candidatus Kapabacteria bacterium]